MRKTGVGDWLTLGSFKQWLLRVGVNHEYEIRQAKRVLHAYAIPTEAMVVTVNVVAAVA